MNLTIDRLLGLAVETGELPGVVALATNEHEVIYAGAAGSRRLAGADAMTVDTVFAIASMTKAITSVAALQLVERGLVSLDEPLGPRLPELAAVQVLDGFEPDGAPRMRAPRRPITLRHLLTHTAGFAYATWNADLLRLQQTMGESFRPLQAPLVRDAGERWEYGINIDWAGRLIEHLTGQSLDGYFRDQIFGPLGMASTGFVLSADQRARLANNHQRQPDGSLVPIEPASPTAPAPTFFNGGGGLYSTGPDYVRFLRMLLNQGQLDGVRVLQSDSVVAMGRNQIGELSVQPLRSVMPERSNDAAFHPDMVTRWGLAGVINTGAAATGRSANSWAWAGLSNTYFWIDPSRGLAGVLLAQILPFCDPAVLRLFDQFERAVYSSGPG